MTKDPRATLRAALASYIKLTYGCTPQEFAEGYERTERRVPYIVNSQHCGWDYIHDDPAFPEEGIDCVRLYESISLSQ